jgi:hypothetical protein
VKRRWLSGVAAFYDDKRRMGSADAFHSYAPQDYIAELFEGMKRYLHRFWNLPGA